MAMLSAQSVGWRVKGWFSPGQVFVLDEYCARYGVRGCHRHLCYLTDLLDFAELATMIDPTLIHYSFAFCASHTHGNRSGQPFLHGSVKERWQQLLTKVVGETFISEQTF